MTESNVYISDLDDSISNTTIDSEVDDVKWLQTQCQDKTTYASRTSISHLSLPVVNVLDGKPIQHITSVALQNCTDITFGNKMMYNGPITVNQYKVGKTNFGKKAFEFIKRRKILSTIVVAIVISITIAVTYTLLLLRHIEVDDPFVFNIDNDTTPLRLVTREEWQARTPTGEIEDLVTPVPLIIIQHTVQPSCDSLETCSSRVRHAQFLHIYDPDFLDDIGYNFLVGGDGAAYEGRGWDKLGSHTARYNRNSIGVAFIGDFREEMPTKQQVIALLKLLRDGVNIGKILQNYTLVAASQVHRTESPGTLLVNILMRLPHWSDDIKCEWNSNATCS